MANKRPRLGAVEARKRLMNAAKDGDLAEIERVVAMRDDAMQLRNSHHNTPLRAAVAAGQLDAAALLVRHGADINQVNHGRSSLMEVAAFHGHTHMVAWLRENGLPAGLLEMSAIGDLDGMIKELASSARAIEKRDRRGQTALHYAARSGQVRAIELLLAYDVAVNTWDRHAHTPLAEAVEWCQTDAVRVLLHGNADPNGVAGFYGGSMLHRAAIRKSTKIVKLLLAAGADPNAQDAGGKTPLHDAIGTGNYQMVELFLRHPNTDLTVETDATKFSSIGETPLEYARNRRKSRIVALLEQRLRA